MNIIKKTKTPDGVDIQLENWDGEYMIGAYPASKVTTRNGFRVLGEIFRLTIAMFRNNEKCSEAFQALADGTIGFADLLAHCWNGVADAIALGYDERQYVKKLLEDMKNIMDPKTKRIEMDWLGFVAGTSQKAILDRLDKAYNVPVTEMLADIER